jgi:hypothetical protein
VSGRNLLRSARLLTACLAASCGREEDDPACAEVRALSTPVAGDVNGDGVADLTDGLAIRSYARAGGPPPACDAAADVVVDGLVEPGDGIALWSHLFVGTTRLQELPPGACEPVSSNEDPPCAGDVSFTPVGSDVTAASGSIASFPAAVEIRGATAPVEGWSFGVSAEGCAIAGATTAGTRAADVRDGGLREGGYDHTEVKDGHAVTAVALSWRDEVGATGDVAVLALTVEANVGTACAPCTLRVEDGLAGAGGPVAAIAAVKGRSAIPRRDDVAIQVCPGG